MNSPRNRLYVILETLLPQVYRIRHDLPRWYPCQLMPILQRIAQSIGSPNVDAAILDLWANQLAEVLSQQDETTDIARELELCQLADADKAQRPREELPDIIILDGRIRNDCDVLVRKIIEEFSGPEQAPDWPSVSPWCPEEP